MDDTQPWMRKLHAPFQKFCKTSTTSSFSLVALIHRIESPPTSFPYPPSTSPLDSPKTPNVHQSTVALIQSSSSSSTTLEPLSINRFALVFDDLNKN
ncbi:hypothetical protein OUZ56_008935 [Daphnia magna]|uniref:Uncharacterized protein n=1 Tax=Daphnia magna TaxID=35525 RepID=A0ABR0AET7_9CRUS|nr:hypothetical protein OUZ56_008935 [Daphnia magna]